MSKDQAIGVAIVATCLLIAVFFITTLFFPQWLSNVGTQATASEIQFWIIATPVLIAFVAVIAIGAWIGWTMATTPLPKPIEEIAASNEAKDSEDKEPTKL